MAEVLNCVLRGCVALDKIFDDAVEFFVRVVSCTHAVFHAAIHVACDLLKFQTHKYLFRPPIPGVENRALVGG